MSFRLFIYCITLFLGIGSVYKASLGSLAPDSPLPASTTFGLDSLSVRYDSLSEAEKRLPDFALAGLKVPDDLEISLFAAEPTLLNPTAITVDDRGRVWVCEGYNYRPSLNKSSKSDFGDRILILEDTDGDGRADRTKVFYQGPELNAPLGIWVMGTKVIVSQSPYVWLFSDDNNDGVADRKEILLRGIGGTQDDHGVHALVQGPDGKFYFTMGSKGKQLLDANGRRPFDKFDRPINFQKYKQGLTLRCDADFTNWEVLGDNFRNSYDLAVDSYGSVWQADADEPGHGAVRLNYVMQHGNFGYMDQKTGRTWRIFRTNLEDEIPKRHWHQNDPGIVPNIAEIGDGSPKGSLLYEGEALPRRLWDTFILCDAGSQSVRAYRIESKGSGYVLTASLPLIEVRAADTWFRPSDVAVAPDGSLFVSDWYDPLADENRAADFRRGRIYRISPKQRTSYTPPTLTYDTPDNAAEALQNPNPAVQYLARKALLRMELAAEPTLEQLLRKPTVNPRMRARALWVMSQMEGVSTRILEIALRDLNPNIRITALRAIIQRNQDPTEYIKWLVSDRDPAVRRECALAIYQNHTYEAKNIWLHLAKQYSGNDRWYVEALGIGAEGQWEWIFPAWLSQTNHQPLQTPAGRDIIWRARTKQAVPYLTTLAAETSVSLKERERYFRAFDFVNEGSAKSQSLLRVAQAGGPDQVEVTKLALRHLDPDYVRESPRARKALESLLNLTYGTPDYIELVSRYELETEYDRLFQLAATQSESPIGRDAARELLKLAGKSFIEEKIQEAAPKDKIALLSALKTTGSEDALALLSIYASGPSQPTELRRAALEALAGSWEGEDLLVEWLSSGRLNEAYRNTAALAISNAFRTEVRTTAERYIDWPELVVSSRHPPLPELLKRTGDASRGKLIFQKQCATCHQVGNQGVAFGPSLSDAGNLYSKERLYAVLFSPDTFRDPRFQAYEITTQEGKTSVGILESQSENDFVLRLPNGSRQTIPSSQVASHQKLTTSLMPAGMAEALRTQELINLVEYIRSLKVQ